MTSPSSNDPGYLALMALTPCCNITPSPYRGKLLCRQCGRKARYVLNDDGLPMVKTSYD